MIEILIWYSYGHSAQSEVIESYKAKITINLSVTTWSAWIREVIEKHHQLWVSEKFLETKCVRNMVTKLLWRNVG